MRYYCKTGSKRGGDLISVYQRDNLIFKAEKRIIFFGNESIFTKNDQVFLQVRYYNYLFSERVKVVKDFLEEKMDFDVVGRKVNLIRGGSIYRIKGDYLYKNEKLYAFVNYIWQDLAIYFLFHDPDEMHALYFILSMYIDSV